MLKIPGLILILIACTSVGFFKSFELKRRYEKLLNMQKGVFSLKERIRLSGGELDRLLNEAFTMPIDYSGLYKTDSEILENLFSDIALLERESAYNRCELAYGVLGQKLSEAKERYKELSKLYKSIGVLGGIFICIFFL